MSSVTESRIGEQRGVSPKVIMAVPSLPGQNLEKQIANGSRQRVDYLELRDELCAENVQIIDKNTTPAVLRLLNTKIPYNLGVGLKASIEAFKGADHLFYTAENPALVHLFVRSAAETTAIIHHPLSSTKSTLYRKFPLLSQLDNLIVLSDAEKEAFEDAVPQAQGKTSVQHTGIDTDFFTPQGSDSSAEPFILSSGASKRNYQLLLKSMDMLSDVPCVISASTHFDPVAVNLHERTLPQNVRDVPATNDLDVRSLVDKSLFGVISTQDTTQWTAGCTTATIFQAMGKPVVTTYLPGLAEYVKHGETGLIVETNNPKKLAEAIDYLWRNPDLVIEMGKKARQFVVENFSLRKWSKDMATRFKTSK